MFEYVEHPEYMIDIDNRVGLCFGVSYTEEKDGEGDFTEHRFELHFDDQELSKYRNIPSQLEPFLQRFNQQPRVSSYMFYAR